MKKYTIKKYNIKKCIGIMVILLLGIVGIININYATEANAEIEDWVIKFNSIIVPEKEFKMFLQDEKALTVSHFSQVYGAEYGEGFWKSKYKGVSPLEYAKEQAIKELKQVKIEQEMAKQYGVLEDTHYNYLMKKIESMDTTYGVQNMDPFQAYSVYHSKLVLDTKEAFKKKNKKVDEKRLKELYETSKDILLTAPDEIEVLDLVIEVNEKEKQEVLKNIQTDLMQGIDTKVLIDKYKDKSNISITPKHYGEVEGKDEYMTEIEIILKEQAKYLNEGEMSQVINNGNENHILICIKKEEGHIMSFEESRSILEDMIKEEMFAETINNMKEEVEIESNKVAYEKIEIE